MHRELPFVIGVIAELSAEGAVVPSIRASEFVRVTPDSFAGFWASIHPGIGGPEELTPFLAATWRGLALLVSRVPRDVQIRVLNTTKKALRQDLQRAVSYDQSWLFKLVHDNIYGVLSPEPFGLLLGGWEFDSTPVDLDLLERVSQIAAAIHAPFVAAASPAMFLAETFAELSQRAAVEKIFEATHYAKWRSLRKSEDSRYLALTVPRIRLGMRRPDATADSPDGHLWGPAVWALAVCLATGSARLDGLPPFGKLNGPYAYALDCVLDLRFGWGPPSTLAVVILPKDANKPAQLMAGLGFLPAQLAFVAGKDPTSCVGFPLMPCVNEQDSLPLMLVLSKLARELKVLVGARTFGSVGECERELNRWIEGFVGDGLLLRSGHVHLRSRGEATAAIVRAVPNGALFEEMQFGARTVVVLPPGRITG